MERFVKLADGTIVGWRGNEPPAAVEVFSTNFAALVDSSGVNRAFFVDPPGATLFPNAQMANEALSSFQAI